MISKFFDVRENIIQETIYDGLEKNVLALTKTVVLKQV
jgi:hypothetical protein